MSTAEIIPLRQPTTGLTFSLRERVGGNIRYWRSMRSLKQETLAYLIGVSSQTISRIERGSVSVNVDSIEEICAALNVRPEALFQEGEGK